ncbi:papain-like cysteine protease family protein [Micromonospora sp. NPDC023633]|uniref:papain-like cysteine protease family protein n=1 Tax=Micromonospora sp. NPDC023633 TaxID=3154320 RepID=UPI00340C63B3
MPLSVPDLASLDDTPVTIRSTAFPNVFLRLAGGGVTAATATGGGYVNCQYTPVGDFERFRVRRQTDGTYSFESVFFPNVCVRMDGTGVTSQTVNGGGTVNCQFTPAGSPPSAYERFKAKAQADGSMSFESAAFPNVYLRMEASGFTANNGNGGGTVNCQYNANGGSHEKFFLNMVDQRLNFAMQRQVQTMWCWAASAVSIAAFYNANTNWTQCSLVNAERGVNNCCGDAGANWPCNQGSWPEGPMQRVGHLRERLVGVLTPAQVGAELAKSRPFAINTAWAGGGGHILVVRGRYVADGVEYVSVGDPWYGDSDVTYEAFRNRYQGSGSWTHTYKTQA